MCSYLGDQSWISESQFLGNLVHYALCLAYTLRIVAVIASRSALGARLDRQGNELTKQTRNILFGSLHSLGLFGISIG